MSSEEWEKRKAEILENLSLLEEEIEYLRKSIPEIRHIVFETTADGAEEADKKIDAILCKLNIFNYAWRQGLHRQGGSGGSGAH